MIIPIIIRRKEHYVGSDCYSDDDCKFDFGEILMEATGDYGFIDESKVTKTLLPFIGREGTILITDVGKTTRAAFIGSAYCFLDILAIDKTADLVMKGFSKTPTGAAILPNILSFTGVVALITAAICSVRFLTKKALKYAIRVPGGILYTLIDIRDFLWEMSDKKHMEEEIAEDAPKVLKK